MADGNLKTAASAQENKTGEKAAGKDDCRCEEVSEMTPRELLKLAISDLAFWKKTKKG